MTEFLILYHAPKSLQDKCKDMSKEDMSKMMQAWGEGCYIEIHEKMPLSEC